MHVSTRQQESSGSDSSKKGSNVLCSEESRDNSDCQRSEDVYGTRNDILTGKDLISHLEV